MNAFILLHNYGRVHVKSYSEMTKKERFDFLANRKAKIFYDKLKELDSENELTFERVKRFTSICIIAFEGDIFCFNYFPNLDQKMPEILQYIPEMKKYRSSIYDILKSIWGSDSYQIYDNEMKHFYTLLGIISAFISEE